MKNLKIKIEKIEDAKKNKQIQVGTRRILTDGFILVECNYKYDCLDSKTQELQNQGFSLFSIENQIIKIIW